MGRQLLELAFCRTSHRALIWALIPLIIHARPMIISAHWLCRNDRPGADRQRVPTTARRLAGMGELGGSARWPGCRGEGGGRLGLASVRTSPALLAGFFCTGRCMQLPGLDPVDQSCTTECHFCPSHIHWCTCWHAALAGSQAPPHSPVEIPPHPPCVH